MPFIVLLRNPHSRRLMALMDGEDDSQQIAEYDSRQEADEDAAARVACFSWGYDVVETNI